MINRERTIRVGPPQSNGSPSTIFRSFPGPKIGVRNVKLLKLFPSRVALGTTRTHRLGNEVLFNNAVSLADRGTRGWYPQKSSRLRVF